ncbi:ABC transporter ATP-binding protein [Micromonospora parva]|uniref:ABC transporter ATP-binding protein n=1 Tax=Micromonospora parva TaxID=1464048 RepID=UPI0033D37C68
MIGWRTRRGDIAADDARGLRASAPPARSARRIRTACLLVGRAAPVTVLGYVVLMLGTGALPVLIAWLTKGILDGIAGDVAPKTLTQIGVALAVAGMVAGSAPQLTRYLRAELDRSVGLLAQGRLFTAVDRFVGLDRFEDPQFLDRLRLAQQTGGTTPSQVMDGVLGTARTAITVTGFLGSLYLFSPMLAVLVLASAVPMLATEMLLARYRAGMQWRIGPAERREFFYSQLLSTSAAAKEVRLFGTGGHLRARMLADRRTVNRAKHLNDRRELLAQVGLALVSAVVAGVGLLWAVRAAAAGRITVGEVTVFVAAVAGVQNALATLASEIARAHHALLMFDHYVAVTTSPPDLPIASVARPVDQLGRGVELRDVWFRYSAESPWVLRGVNLWIPAGATLAVVGLNGAGKSTLVKLLCRFHDPTRGQVLWDGVDIREVDPTQLRRRIGAVFQDYMHYDLTAAENIALGDLTAMSDRGRITAAARTAGIHDVLTALPHGYDTLLSRIFYQESDKQDPTTGVVLSGGQWQRLALARAFLRDRPDLLILDEPSAGLDAAAEDEIHHRLLRYRTGRTSVLISHRLGTLRDADLIVVIADGRVTERGTHDSLIAADGTYRRLFDLQASGYGGTAGSALTTEAR